MFWGEIELAQTRTIAMRGRSAWVVALEIWRITWFPTVGVVLGFGIFIVAGVGWKVLEQADAGVEGPITQMQMLIAVAQAVLAYVIAMSAIHSAKTNAESAWKTRERGEEDVRRQRADMIHAFAGSAIESSSHAATLATLQRDQLAKGPLARESAAQRDFALSTWTVLIKAVAATSTALERLRYEGDGRLINPAERLFDVVLDIQRLAFEGKAEEVQSRAGEVRSLANELLDAALGRHSAAGNVRP